MLVRRPETRTFRLIKVEDQRRAVWIVWEDGEGESCCIPGACNRSHDQAIHRNPHLPSYPTLFNGLGIFSANFRVGGRVDATAAADLQVASVALPC